MNSSENHFTKQYHTQSIPKTCTSSLKTLSITINKGQGTDGYKQIFNQKLVGFGLEKYEKNSVNYIVYSLTFSLFFLFLERRVGRHCKPRADL